MKHLFSLILLFLIVFPVSCQENSKIEKKEASTYYFIRHAEKNRSDKSNKNPHLTQAGLLRAAKWSYVFEHVKFDAIYSSDYKRTKETAAPTAEKNGVSITLYDPRAIDSNAFKIANAGNTVLIVGHSNTTPSFVNALIGKDKYAQMDDSNNSGLYIVTISASGEISDALLIID